MPTHRQTVVHQTFLRFATLLCSALSLLTGCGGGAGSSSDVDGGQTVNTSIASAHTGVSYGVQVYLPPGYEKSTTRYPVIYAMDGPFRFNTLLPQLQARGYNNIVLVVVDPISSARRFVDFPMPGAEAYYRFFTTELVPAIESRYRIDPTRRTLSGHSLSAEFALFALYMEQPQQRFFANYIVADCSCWLTSNAQLQPQWDVPANMEQAMFMRSSALPVKLVMSGDTTANYQRATDVYQRITQRGYTGLSARFDRYSVGHVQMDGPSFADALPFIFGAPSN